MPTWAYITIGSWLILSAPIGMLLGRHLRSVRRRSYPRIWEVPRHSNNATQPNQFWQQSQQARDELRRVVGFSVADEIDKLDRLKKAGSISDDEFTRLRARLVQ
jgi:hypothetical protein